MKLTFFFLNIHPKSCPLGKKREGTKTDILKVWSVEYFTSTLMQQTVSTNPSGKTEINGAGGKK